MHTIFPKVAAFRIALEKLGGDYICATRLPDATATVSFLGQFQGHTVLWNMTLATLAHYRLTGSDAVPAAEQKFFNCPFIEVNAGTEGVFPLIVGLDLAVIDEPVIKKSIIMIRNYRRLALGKIEFCPGNA